MPGAARRRAGPGAEGGGESTPRSLRGKLAEVGGAGLTNPRVRSRDGRADLVGSTPDVVMLDTAPAGVLEIVGDRLPSRVRAALSRYTYGPAAFKVDFAIEGHIPWTNPDCRRAGTLHLGLSLIHI